MDVILTDISAWTVYASGAPMERVPKAEAARVLGSVRLGAGDVARLRATDWWNKWEPFDRALLGLPQDRKVPAHVLMALEHQHGGRGAAVCHRAPTANPDGLLRRVQLDRNESIYLVSPEAYPVLRAHRLDEVCLSVLLSQLWDDYFVHPDAKGGIWYRPGALTCEAEVRSMAMALDGCRGRSLVLKVLPYVAEGSHSPMETVLQLALCLPKRLGGCGLPLPAMNAEIDLPKEVWAVFKGRQIRPDLSWLEQGLVVEYDSFAEHDQTGAQAERDRLRRDAYDRMGLRIVTVDRSTIRDDLRRNLAFERISKSLGVRYDWSSDMQLKRRDLVWRLVRVQQLW